MPCERWAVLATGQLSRFAYEHGFAPFEQARPGCQRGEPRLDVHVALSLTNYTRLGEAAWPSPYAAGLPSGAAVQRMQRWFDARVRGAHLTSLALLDEPTLQLRMAELDVRVSSSDPALWRASAPQRSRVLHGNIVRWVHNSRMLYLRHAAYMAALRTARRDGGAAAASDGGQSGYKYFLCLREDNYWLAEPLPSLLELAGTMRGRRASSRGVVAVDTHCGFAGAHADKIFFANGRGAQALFGNSTAAHVAMLLRWLAFGVGRQAGSPGYQHRADDPMQSEAFMTHHLRAEGVAVRTWPFQRTDVRFDDVAPVPVSSAGGGGGARADGGLQVPPRPCVRVVYWACGPKVLRERRGRVGGGPPPACAPATPQERKLWAQLAGGGRLGSGEALKKKEGRAKRGDRAEMARAVNVEDRGKDSAPKTPHTTTSAT